MTKQRENEPRPAEEVAREMVPPAYTCGTYQPRTHIDLDGRRVVVLLDRDDGAAALQDIIASTITRAREEGAATALHGVAQADREHLGREVRAAWVSWAREQPSPKPSWLVSWEGISEPDREVDRRIGERLFAMGAAAERARQQPADVALYPAPDAPGQWVAHHVTRDLVTQGDSEPHALRMLAEAIEMMDGAPEQPRDLAGRIRALIHDYEDQWADACDEEARSATQDAHDRAHALRVVIDDLRDVYLAVRQGRSLRNELRWLRREGQHLGNGALLGARRRAADDLEAIARECAPERER